MDSRPTLNEAMEAADILRGMLDDEQDKNRVLKERLKEWRYCFWRMALQSRITGYGMGNSHMFN